MQVLTFVDHFFLLSFRGDKMIQRFVFLFCCSYIKVEEKNRTIDEEIIITEIID